MRTTQNELIKLSLIIEVIQKGIIIIIFKNIIFSNIASLE